MADVVSTSVAILTQNVLRSMIMMKLQDGRCRGRVVRSWSLRRSLAAPQDEVGKVATERPSGARS